MYSEFKPLSPMRLMDFVQSARSCIQEISADQLEKMQEELENLMVIDVRESAEHQQTGHIHGAHFIPRGILEAAADPATTSYPRLSEARKTPIVLYCATGGRSAMATAVLQMMGFENVCSLSGGFNQWAESGKPISTEAHY